MRCLSFTVNDEFYAVDVTMVMKIERKLYVVPVAAAPRAVAGLANMKGRIVTILHLGALLNTGSPEYGGKDENSHVNAIIFKPFGANGDLMGLVIDKPGDLTKVDEKHIQPPQAADLVGSCMTGIAEAKGRLYRIIDVEIIMRNFMGGTADNEKI